MSCQDEQRETIDGQETTRDDPETESQPKVNPADHIRLVYMVARRFLRPGRDIEDLASVGKIGLMEAVHKFDPSQDMEFSTYAVSAITNHLIKHVCNQGWPIRIPFGLVRNVKASDRGEPLPLSPESKFWPQLQERMELARRVMQAHVYGTFVKFDYDYVCAVECDPASGLEAAEERDKAAVAVRQLVERLSRKWPRDALIVKLHWGLDGAPPMTFEEIGRSLGITHQAARQAEYKAMERLRMLAGTDGSREDCERRERIKRLRDRQNQARNEKRRAMIAERKKAKTIEGAAEQTQRHVSLVCPVYEGATQKEKGVG